MVFGEKKRNTLIPAKDSNCQLILISLSLLTYSTFGFASQNLAWMHVKIQDLFMLCTKIQFCVQQTLG